MGATRETTIRVLICDGVPMVRGGLVNVLEAEPDIEVVGATGDGCEAISVARRLLPDVVIIDVELSGKSGFEVATQVAQLSPESPPEILMFTSRVDDASIMRALEAGAYGYMIKEVDSKDLIRAVRALAAGEAAASGSVTRRLIDWLFWRNAQPISTARRALGQLTTREQDVLKLVAKGMSNTDIAKELSISVATVRSHVYNVREKLDLADRAQLVTFAYQSGFTVPKVPEPR